MAHMQKPLTAEQREALNDFIREHGRQWKTVLQRQWRNASATPILHGLRNTHGIGWLHTLRLERYNKPREG